MPLIVLASMGCFVLNRSVRGNPEHSCEEGEVSSWRRDSDSVSRTVPFFLVFLEEGMPVVWQKKEVDLVYRIMS